MLPFGERLAELRNDKGLTQEQFGKIFNIGRNMIYFYEKGTSEPSFEQLVQFAKFFNVSVDYLLGMTRESDTYKELPFVIDKEANSIKFINSLTSQSWKSVEQLLLYLFHKGEI